VSESLEAKLTHVLGARFKGFESLEVCQRLSGGASQETYRLVAKVDGAQRLFCLRRAPGGNADAISTGPGLDTEARLMEVARSAGIPAPIVYYVLDSADGIGQGFLMQWLDGETIGSRIVRSEQLSHVRSRLAFECGEILARIHAIDLDSTGLGARLERLTPAQCVERTWQQYRELDTPQPMLDYTARWLSEKAPQRFTPGLVHGEFRNGNLMVSPTGVVGVLDWEIAHVGDPMRDLGWMCVNSWRFGCTHLPVGGFGHYDDLFAGYESVSGQVVDWERVEFWMVFGSFWWAVICLVMAQYFRSGRDKSVERAAIGRRTTEGQVDCVNLLFPGPVDLANADFASVELPRLDELVEGASDYLSHDVVPITEGRTRYLARVAGNALAIVQRDLAFGWVHRREELSSLQALLNTSGDLNSLRWVLVEGLRDGTIALDRPGLEVHLRQSVVNQLAIDQPSYSGFETAIGNA